MEEKSEMEQSFETRAFLQHFGIKGMQWGRRRKVNPTTGRVGSSEDFVRARELRRTKSHKLSNRELEIANTRANLEGNFARNNPSRRRRGEAYVKGLIATAGIAASVASLAQGPLGKAAISLGKKHTAKTLKIAASRTFS